KPGDGLRHQDGEVVEIQCGRRLLLCLLVGAIVDARVDSVGSLGGCPDGLIGWLWGSSFGGGLRRGFGGSGRGRPASIVPTSTLPGSDSFEVVVIEELIACRWEQR